MVTLAFDGDQGCTKEAVMIVRYSFVFLAVLLWSLPHNERASVSNARATDRTAGSVYGDCKHEPATIKSAMQQLLSGDYERSQKAQKALLNLAQQSAPCRQEVVRSLIREMDKPNLDFERQPSNYYLWKEGSQVLADLKATEALDLLISHLDLTNGFHSASMAFQPAIVGVSKMGQAAVPKLALALQKNPKPRIRMAAAYCLTSIGGAAARDALRLAQSGETDQCVAKFIDISLNTFSYKSKDGIAFDIASPHANAKARRTWLMAFECFE